MILPVSVTLRHPMLTTKTSLLAKLKELEAA